MNEEIGSYDAKTKLPEILRRVEAGERFTITNRGKPVADLVPSRSRSDLRIEGAIANILKAKKQVVSGEELAEFKDHGRK
jgi:prevent-host-death family protein